jgi:SAM-dependent methyltransferase
MQREQFLAHAELEDRHWWFTGRRAILKRVVAAVAPPGQGMALLDIGCGTGGNVAAFAGGYAVLGLDPSNDAIELARARFPAVRFEQTADPEVGREHLQRGGVLLMSDVLEHVADDQELLDRAIAVVPSGGHLELTAPADPALWSRHDVDFGHFRRYRSEQFQALWRGAPVEQRLLSSFNSRLRPLIAAMRRVAPGLGNNLHVPVGPLNGMLRRIFAGEAGALVAAIDRGLPPFRRGVSLVAVLRKR